MVFEMICNYRPRKNENNVSKACILMVFETAEEILKTMSLKHAF